MKKTLKIPVPDVYVHIIKTKDVGAYLKKFVKTHPGFTEPSASVNGAAMCNYPLYGSQHWMVFKSKPAARTVSHECIHVVDQMCERFGINDFEFRGYMIGYLVEQINLLK